MNQPFRHIKVAAYCVQFVFCFQILFASMASANEHKALEQSRMFQQALEHRSLFSVSEDSENRELDAYSIQFRDLDVLVEQMPGDGSSFRIDGALISIDFDQDDQHNAFAVAEQLSNRFPEKFAFHAAYDTPEYSLLNEISELLFPTAHAGLMGLIVVGLVVAAIVVLAARSKKKSKSKKTSSRSKSGSSSSSASSGGKFTSGSPGRPYAKKRDQVYNAKKGDYYAAKNDGSGKTRNYKLPANPTLSECQQGARNWHDYHKKNDKLGPKSNYICN